MASLARILLFIGTLAGGASSWAFDAVDELEQQVISSQTSSQEREALRTRVAAYRSSIENDSYKTTLRLCLAYRQFSGLGNSHAARDFSLADSIRAWDEIANTGLRNAFQSWWGLGENKAYADIEGFDFFTVNYWDSAHLILFLKSFGFLKGAVHCLNSTNRIEIERFASWIVLADSFGTGFGHSLGVGSHLAGGGLIGKGLFAAIKSTQRWWHYFYPLAGALQYSKRILFTRKVMGALGVTLGAAGAYKLFCREKSERTSILEESLRNGGLKSPSGRFGAILVLYQTYADQHAMCRQKLNKQELYLADMDKCVEEKLAITDLIGELQIREHMSDFREDLMVYSRKRTATPELESQAIKEVICLKERAIDDKTVASTRRLYVTMLSSLMPILNSN
jgi:hypothetical protein